jgi:hypothetical protein
MKSDDPILVSVDDHICEPADETDLAAWHALTARRRT